MASGKVWPALLAFLLFPVSGVAGPASYKCEIHDYLGASPTGQFQPQAWSKKSGSFNVARRSGWIVGDWLGNAAAAEIRVTSPGDKEWSFRVASFFKTGEVSVLEVHEYADGAKKPFLALVSGGVLTGLCE